MNEYNINLFTDSSTDAQDLFKEKIFFKSRITHSDMTKILDHSEKNLIGVQSGCNSLTSTKVGDQNILMHLDIKQGKIFLKQSKLKKTRGGIKLKEQKYILKENFLSGAYSIDSSFFEQGPCCLLRLKNSASYISILENESYYDTVQEENIESSCLNPFIRGQFCLGSMENIKLYDINFKDVIWSRESPCKNINVGMDYFNHCSTLVFGSQDCIWKLDTRIPSDCKIFVSKEALSNYDVLNKYEVFHCFLSSKELPNFFVFCDESLLLFDERKNNYPVKIVQHMLLGEPRFPHTLKFNSFETIGAIDCLKQSMVEIPFISHSKKEEFSYPYHTDVIKDSLHFCNRKGKLFNQEANMTLQKEIIGMGVLQIDSSQFVFIENDSGIIFYKTFYENPKQEEKYTQEKEILDQYIHFEETIQDRRKKPPSNEYTYVPDISLRFDKKKISNMHESSICKGKVYSLSNKKSTYGVSAHQETYLNDMDSYFDKYDHDFSKSLIASWKEFDSENIQNENLVETDHASSILDQSVIILDSSPCNSKKVDQTILIDETNVSSFLDQTDLNQDNAPKVNIVPKKKKRTRTGF